MHLLKNSGSFTRYVLTAPVEGDVAQKLRRLAFRPIDDETGAECSLGFVPVEDMLDCEWAGRHPAVGEYYAYSLRKDTRRVSPALLRKERALAEKREREAAATAGKRLSRLKRREIAETVKLRLLAKAFPIPAVFNVVQGKKEMWLNTTNGKALVLFEDLFTAAMERTPTRVDALTLAGIVSDHRGLQLPDGARSDSRLLGREFLTWLLYISQGVLEVRGHTIVTLDRVSLAGDGVSVFTLSRDNAMDEVRASLAAGKLVDALKISIEGEASYSLLLKSDLSFHGLKTPKIEAEGDTEEARLEGQLLEKVYFLEQVGGIVDELFARFVMERGDEAVWLRVQKGLTAWAQNAGLAELDSHNAK